MGAKPDGLRTSRGPEPADRGDRRGEPECDRGLEQFTASGTALGQPSEGHRGDVVSRAAGWAGYCEYPLWKNQPRRAAADNVAGAARTDAGERSGSPGALHNQLRDGQIYRRDICWIPVVRQAENTATFPLRLRPLVHELHLLRPKIEARSRRRNRCRIYPAQHGWDGWR